MLEVEGREALVLLYSLTPGVALAGTKTLPPARSHHAPNALSQGHSRSTTGEGNNPIPPQQKHDESRQTRRVPKDDSGQGPSRGHTLWVGNSVGNSDVC